MNNPPIVLGVKGIQVPKLSVQTDSEYLFGLLSPDQVIRGYILKSRGGDRTGENAPEVIVDSTAGASVKEVAEHIEAGKGLYVVLGHNIDL